MRPALLSLIVFGLICALVVRLPARLLDVSQYVQQLRVGHYRGTIWNGSAHRIRAESLPETTVNWRVLPLSALTGAPKVSFGATGNWGSLSGQVRYAGKSRLLMEDLVAELDLNAVPWKLWLGAVSFAGVVSGHVDRIEFLDRLPLSVSGALHWESARMIVPPAVDLGDIDVEITPTETASLAAARNSGGEINLTGSLGLDHSGEYRLDLHLTPNAKTSEATADVLAWLLPANADGSFQIKAEDSLRRNSKGAPSP